MKFEAKFTHIYSRKCIWKYLLRNGIHIVSASMCWILLGSTEMMKSGHQTPRYCIYVWFINWTKMRQQNNSTGWNDYTYISNKITKRKNILWVLMFVDEQDWFICLHIKTTMFAALIDQDRAHFGIKCCRAEDGWRKCGTDVCNNNAMRANAWWIYFVNKT